LLSTFPILIAAVSLIALLADPQWALEQITRFVDELVPAGRGFLVTVTEEVLESRGPLSVVSVLVLVWSGTRVFGAIMKALNIVFNTGERYSIWRRTLVEMIMLLTLGAVFLVTIASQVLMAYLIYISPLADNNTTSLTRTIAQIMLAGLLFLGFYLVYKHVPRCHVDRRAALVGAFLAVFLFMLARPLFSNYVSRFANYAGTYGSLALVITFVVWVWFVSLIVIFSGEVASHYQAIILESRSPQQVERQHLRRSPTAKDLPQTHLPLKEEEVSGKE
jgi:membrane protein